MSSPRTLSALISVLMCIGFYSECPGLRNLRPPKKYYLAKTTLSRPAAGEVFSTDQLRNFEDLPSEIFTESDQDHPSTHRRLNDGLLLMLCIIGTVLFFPLGLFALYNLLKARRHFREGKVSAARTRAFFAQILSLVAVLLGMVWLGLVIGLTV